MMNFSSTSLAVFITTTTLASQVGWSCENGVFCEDRQCKVRIASPLVETAGLPAQREGKLTPFWAHENTGIDLAREYLETLPTREKVPFGVIDGGIDLAALTGELTPSYLARSTALDFQVYQSGHGTRVTNLLNGKAPFGVGVDAQLTDFQTNHRRALFFSAAESMRETAPKLINLSVSVSAHPAAQRNLNELAQRSILVAAAGNSYPRPLAAGLKTFKGIVVGSLEPSGFITDSSQEGEEVTLLAPSGYLLLAPDSDATIARIGQTSGATPLVTGALANVLSLIPDLELAEAKALLTETALPTLNSRQIPHKNGAGMLNAYLLVRVAERLRGLNLEQRRLVISDSQKKLFDFKSESAAKTHEGIALLRHEVALKRRVGLNHIRAAFLLDPRNIAARDALIHFYRELGFTVNAAYYKTFIEEDREKILSQGMFSEDRDTRNSAIRTAVVFGPGALDMIKTHVKNLTENMPALTAISTLGRLSLPILEEAVQTITEPNQLASLVRISATVLHEDAQSILTLALQNHDFFIKDVAHQMLGALGEKSIPLLIEVMKTSHRSSLASPLAGASLLGEKGFPVFMEYLNRLKDMDKNERATSLMMARDELPSFGVHAVSLLRELLHNSVTKGEDCASTVWPLIEMGARPIPLTTSDPSEHSIFLKDLRQCAAQLEAKGDVYDLELRKLLKGVLFNLEG